MLCSSAAFRESAFGTRGAETDWQTALCTESHNGIKGHNAKRYTASFFCIIHSYFYNLPRVYFYSLIMVLLKSRTHWLLSMKPMPPMSAARLYTCSHPADAATQLGRLRRSVCANTLQNS